MHVTLKYLVSYSAIWSGSFEIISEESYFLFGRVLNPVCIRISQQLVLKCFEVV